jgi:hypothetical protein
LPSRSRRSSRAIASFSLARAVRTACQSRGPCCALRRNST